jgi:hypothetical protein
MTGRIQDHTGGEINAIQLFITQRTVPLLLDRKNGTFEMLGSGTLAELSDRKFIVTARHSVAGKSLQDLALPVSPANKSALQTLGGIVMSMPTTDKVDIAVIDVSNTWLASQPSDGWQFITEANVGQFSAANAFLIVGYPIALMKATSGEISGPPMMVITGMISGAPTSVSDYEPGLDRFFLYGPKSETLDGKTVESIALPGVSGAAVWQYTPFEGAGMWSPDKCLQMLAVENAYKADEYVRAHDWRMVLEIVHKALHPPHAAAPAS